MSLELLISVARELTSPQVLSLLSLSVRLVHRLAVLIGANSQLQFQVLHSDIMISRGEPHPLCPFLKT